MIHLAKVIRTAVALGLVLILIGTSSAYAASQGFNNQIRNCFASIDNALNAASQGGANNYSYRFGTMASTMQGACQLNARLISRQDEQVSYCNYVSERARQAAGVGGSGNYSYRMNIMNQVISVACGG